MTWWGEQIGAEGVRDGINIMGRREGGREGGRAERLACGKKGGEVLRKW